MAAFTSTSVRLIDLDGRELMSRSFPNPKVWISLDLLASPQPKIVELVGDTVQVLDKEGRVELRLKAILGMNPGPGAISLDGSRLATGWSTSKDWAITVHELNGTERPTVHLNPGCFTWSLAFNPDGSRVASTGEDGITRVWNSANGAKVCECRGHRSKVLRAAYRPDGRRLVTTSADGTVRQWDPATGRESRRLTNVIPAR